MTIDKEGQAFDDAHPHLKPRKIIPASLTGDLFLEFIKNLTEDVDWMAHGFMTEQSITMLYATDGIGKSIVGIQGSLELASGLPLLKGFHLEKEFKVIYVVAERSIKEPTKRIKRMIQDPDLAGKIKFNNLTITTEFQGRDLSNSAQSLALLEIIRKHSEKMGGVDIIFFDPLYALVKGDLKEDKAINPVFDFFRTCGVEFGASIFFVHHENRGSREVGATERTGQDFYGNKFISGLCTAVWHMKKDKNDPIKTKINNEKDSESCLVPSFTMLYDPEYGTVRASVSSSHKSKEILTDAFLKEMKDKTQKFTRFDFFAKTGIQMKDVPQRKFLATLAKSGRLSNIAQNGQEGLYIAL